MPKQASLLGSGVSLDSPHEGHSLRDLASIMPGLARSFLFYLIFSCQATSAMNDQESFKKGGSRVANDNALCMKVHIDVFSNEHQSFF